MVIIIINPFGILFIQKIMKAKFENALMRHDLMRNEPEETMDQLIKARDEFAVKFADWLINDYKVYVKKPKELLEIYKKENPTL